MHLGVVPRLAWMRATTAGRALPMRSEVQRASRLLWFASSPGMLREIYACAAVS